MTDFVIRKSFTENAITAMPGWSTDERFTSKAEIIFELLKQETVSTPLVLPTSLVEIKSLIFHYPEASMTSSKSLELSEEVKNKIESETGVRPILPMPDLVSAPNMLVPVNLEKEEVIRQVLEQFVRLSQEMYTANSSPAEGNSNSWFGII
jgi:hypothetical protein